MSEVLFDVSGNKALPIMIKPDLPVDNLKCTRKEACCYFSLVIVKKDSWKSKYIIAKSKVIYKEVDVAPQGAIIRFYYSTGSHKHTYYQITKYFLVAEAPETTIDVSKNGYNGKIATKNLIELEPPSDEALAEVEAEFHNKFQAKPSDYAPVRTLYYFWLIKKVAGEPTPASTSLDMATNSELEQQIKQLEALIKQKEADLEALRHQLEQLRLRFQLECMKAQLV